MNIYFRYRNREMCDSLSDEFANAPGVSMSCCDIFDGPVTDVIISPANGYGIFDGGIDYVYAQRWPNLQPEVQRLHKTMETIGYIPVGSAIAVDPRPLAQSGLDDYRWVVVAPTMMIPESIRSTSNVYYAFYAALMKCRQRSCLGEIESVTCPGMGTGVGQMEPAIAALQMRAAYSHACNYPFQIGEDILKAIKLETGLRHGYRDVVAECCYCGDIRRFT